MDTLEFPDNTKFLCGNSPLQCVCCHKNGLSPREIITGICHHVIRWSQGLIFHQAVVDGARAAILLPLGKYQT